MSETTNGQAASQLPTRAKAFQLTMAEHEPPDPLLALGSGAICALAGLLALADKHSQAAQHTHPHRRASMLLSAEAWSLGTEQTVADT